MAIFGRGSVNLAKSGRGRGCFWVAELDNNVFICRRFLVEVWAAVGQCLVQLSPIFAMAILSRGMGGSWTMSCSAVAQFCYGDFW